MNKLLSAVAFVSALGSQSLAGPNEDAQYIASVTITEEIMQGTLIVMRPVLIQAIQQDLDSKGIEVSNPEAFFDIVADVFLDGFVGELRIPTAQFYAENFSASELRDIAEFYRSPAGQSLVRATPAMMQHGAKSGQMAGVKAVRSVHPEIARRIREEGLIIESKSFTDKLLKAFE